MIKESHTGYIEYLVCDCCGKRGEPIDKFDEETMAVTWGLDNGWQVEIDKDDLCPKCLANTHKE